LGRLMAVGIPLEEVPINPTVIALRALKYVIVWRCDEGEFHR
jgi:hypothetical protein